MGDSKFLILRENRAQHTIIGYFSGSPHWVCQEYSTKWDYMLSLLFFHDHAPLIDWALIFMTFICFGIHQEGVLNLRIWSTRQKGLPSLIGAIRVLGPLIRVYPINHKSVTSLWCPWVGSKRASMNKCVFNRLPIEWTPLRTVGPDYQHEADRSAVQCSCPQLLLGKYLLGMSPFPWGDSIQVLEGSACWWHLDRTSWMWSIGIGTQAPHYTSVLVKLC